jgi:hypothetical protein
MIVDKTTRTRKQQVDDILNGLLNIMELEGKRPFPVGPFTARWARAWKWYYRVLAVNTSNRHLVQ